MNKESRIDERTQPQTLPVVSLLIPMRNEANYIEKCLKSIFSQDYPSDRLEVIVLDGESTDGSKQIVERLSLAHPNCRLMTNPRIIQAAAWNLGIESAHGEIIGIVSAHSELAPDYVCTAVKTLFRTGADMVGGPMRTLGQGLLGQAIAQAVCTPFGVGGGRFHYIKCEEDVDTVYMGLCWRNTYYRIGGFDEEMVRNQDDELSYRLRHMGARIICNPDIRSQYYNRSTLSGLWHQYFQYGYWKIRVLQKHPRQMCLRQFVPSVFVVTLLVSVLLAFINPWGKALFVTVLAAYILSSILASLWVSFQNGWQHLAVLPLIYSVMHVSYGFGFMAGFFRFLGRWGDKGGRIPGFDRINAQD